MMFKDIPFETKIIPVLQFSSSELQVIRHIYRKYLNNKIFYRCFSEPGSRDRQFRKLERNLNLRSCILFFYANSLYNQPFDIKTLHGLFNKLKNQELVFLEQFPGNGAIKEYHTLDNRLPVFLISGYRHSAQGKTDLGYLYNGILEKESKSLATPETFSEKLSRISTTVRFASRLPLEYLFREIKSGNRLTSSFRHYESIASLWETINILSFQINFLVFNRGIRELIRGKSELADLASFVMLLGDDFIDQIARKTGSEKIVTILRQHKEAFEIKIRHDYTLDSSGLVGLYLSLHIENEKVSEMNMLTFDQLFEIMNGIYSEINRKLLKMDPPRRVTACNAISGFLNYCLSTYMDDLFFSGLPKGERCTLRNTGWYFYKKNNCVMMYGLWLRSVLMNMDYEKHIKQIREWGSLVENIQLYDDLKDIKADWNYQPNYALIFSFEFFREEYDWFEKNQDHLTGRSTSDEIIELSIAMPKTVAHIMLLSKFTGIKQLNWFTQFATNYCWKQNWNKAFLRFNFFPKSRGHDLANNPVLSETRNLFSTSSKEVNLVFSLLSGTFSLFETFEKKDFYFDYLLMLCLFDHNFSRNFHLRTGIPDSYTLIFRFQFMKTGHRARLLSSFMKTKRADVLSALEQCKDRERTGNSIIPAELHGYIYSHWL